MGLMAQGINISIVGSDMLTGLKADGSRMGMH